LHSHYSDGAQSPRDLVLEVMANRLKAFALTDHDSMAGIPALRSALNELGAGARFVPGVECSARFEEQEIHILGYFTEDQPPAMLDYLKKVVLERQERNLKMIKRLNQLGYAIRAGDLAEADGEKRIHGRVHMALWLVEHAGFPSIADAFGELLNEGRPAFIPRKRRKVEEVATVIRKAGGVAVLAHPQQYGWCALPSDPDAGRLLHHRFCSIRDQGVQGIECFHGQATPQESRMIRAAASGLDMICTAGSDSHGREDQHASMYRLESVFLSAPSS
ncbi:MAG: PHP domain-containing protein, partial [Clostridiaceae bacterium]|nr:PHP domain-containing protein [Clostridiaceae bacterium]